MHASLDKKRHISFFGEPIDPLREIMFRRARCPQYFSAWSLSGLLLL